VHAITEAVTGAIGDYGLYAVFILMFVDAILPAASELVMVYGGALAAGAFPGSEVTLFGRELESTAWAYVAVATAAGIRLGPETVDGIVKTAAGLAPEASSSLAHDLGQGHRLELEGLHGHAVRLAERLGVSAPTLFAVYAALKPHLEGRSR